MSITESVDITDISLQGGAGELKRHPSPQERHRASEIFNLMKERMPTWKLKKNIKWQGCKEGRVIIIATPGETFSPRPEKSGRFAKTIDDAKTQSIHTDYGIRLNLICPSVTYPVFEMTLEMVALVASGKPGSEHRVVKISPEVFLKETGSNHGIKMSKLLKEFREDASNDAIVTSIQDIMRQEYDEVTTSFVFRHFAKPDSVIKSYEDIQEFVYRLVKQGFKKEMPEWLKPPFEADCSEFKNHWIGINFKTNFIGIRASRMLVNIHHEVILRGRVMFSMDRMGVHVTVYTAPKTLVGLLDAGCVAEGHSSTHLFPSIDNLDVLEEVILRMIEMSVMKTYERSKTWRLPVIWKES